MITYTHDAPAASRPGPQALAVLLLASVAAASQPGCSSMMALSHPDKKNLNVLAPGHGRRAVVAALGEPGRVEREGTERVDTFRFRQGFPWHEKVLRATGHLVADYFTIFIWELPGMLIESKWTATEVRLRVFYGPDDRVTGIDVLEGRGVIAPKLLRHQRPRPGGRPPAAPATGPPAACAPPSPPARSRPPALAPKGVESCRH